MASVPHAADADGRAQARGGYINIKIEIKAECHRRRCPWIQTGGAMTVIISPRGMVCGELRLKCSIKPRGLIEPYTYRESIDVCSVYWRSRLLFRKLDTG